MATALNVQTIDYATGDGLNHALDPRYQKMNPEDLTACFWIAAFRAFYGETISMVYHEFKINILDMLLRHVDLHPKNTFLIESLWYHLWSIQEAEIREAPLEDAPNDSPLAGPITKYEYK